LLKNASKVRKAEAHNAGANQFSGGVNFHRATTPMAALGKSTGLKTRHYNAEHLET
jgi:hypothetical protein